MKWPKYDAFSIFRVFGVGWPPCRRFDPHSKIRGDAPDSVFCILYSVLMQSSYRPCGPITAAVELSHSYSTIIRHKHQACSAFQCIRRMENCTFEGSNLGSPRACTLQPHAKFGENDTQLMINDIQEKSMRTVLFRHPGLLLQGKTHLPPKNVIYTWSFKKIVDTV